MRTATLVLLIAVVALTLASVGTAEAGRGGSPELIRSAIAANSIDAIQAELEHGEYLVCAACADLVLPLVDHPDYRVRKVAAWWLVRRATGRQVYVNMLGRLSQPDSVKAANAADVLGEFGYAAAIPALAAGLSNPIFADTARAAMARALGAIGKSASQTALVTALAPSQPAAVKSASLAALRAIGGFKDSAVVEPLLSDADADVGAQAALTMGDTRTAGGVAALVRVLTSDPSANVRKKAAWALGEMHAPAGEAAPGLEQAANSDASPLVRSLAQVAIGKLAR